MKNIIGVMCCSLVLLTGCQTTKLEEPIVIQKKILKNK